ncbi:hypothetical protein L210DRAFT_3673898 [Boletus edulis BED1]|uniref:Uncharacterized protein n=1 Tax=Boletus edulis BED1 TaxID=1328754 RepID=A0AAD4G6B2_BOLED|nr:hypothetical protein L210DRAFT_3673898 [Boletus edulis BED1]
MPLVGCIHPLLWRRRSQDIRTGTFPYMSYNVLLGRRHTVTQFDNVESFLYVQVLFYFFSYAGPLPVSELREADEAGFAPSIGSGRSPHLRNWPETYAGWADGHANDIAIQKRFAVTSVNGVADVIQSAEFVDCLENYWPEELPVHHPICVLILTSFAIFYNSTLRAAAKGLRTEVSHAEFTSVLDKWLTFDMLNRIVVTYSRMDRPISIIHDVHSVVLWGRRRIYNPGRIEETPVIYYMIDVQEVHPNVAPSESRRLNVLLRLASSSSSLQSTSVPVPQQTEM